MFCSQVGSHCYSQGQALHQVQNWTACGLPWRAPYPDFALVYPCAAAAPWPPYAALLSMAGHLGTEIWSVS